MNDYEKTRWGICSMCGQNTMISDHHWLSQDKIFEKLYPEYIHRKDNLKKSVCSNKQCHGSLKNITEKEFCEQRKIKPRSDTGMLIFNRDPWEVID